MCDLVAGDVERDHHPGNAIQLGQPTRLTVDRALQDHQIWGRADEVDEG